MRTLRSSMVAAIMVAGFVGIPILVSAAGAATAPAATMISVANSSFGKILVVGSGQYSGYTVYTLTSDDPPSFGCTTTVQQLPPGPIVCTGAEGGQSEWPAVTTTGTPVAGPGVKESLLGMVFRSDLGADQVTYAGHPLYLFDTSAGIGVRRGLERAGPAALAWGVVRHVAEWGSGALGRYPHHKRHSRKDRIGRPNADAGRVDFVPRLPVFEAHLLRSLRSDVATLAHFGHPWSFRRCESELCRHPNDRRRFAPSDI